MKIKIHRHTREKTIIFFISSSIPIITLFAAIQYKPPKGNIPQALKEIEALIGEAAQEGASLVVLPEMATTGYVWPDKESIRPHTETKDGDTFQTLSTLAKEHRIWIVCGYAEREEETFYNSALVINSLGECVCNYRKVLLYDADYTWATPGTIRYLIESPFGVIAPGICMDLNDNRFVRFLTTQRPDIVVFCTNWLDEGDPVLDYWQNRLMYWSGTFIAANSWGPEENIAFRGESCILDHSGEVVSIATQTENQILYAPLPSK